MDRCPYGCHGHAFGDGGFVVAGELGWMVVASMSLISLSSTYAARRYWREQNE